MADLDEVVLPGIVHWQAPGWFSYFPANTSGPSILAELASAGLGAQGRLNPERDRAALGRLAAAADAG